ncbi:hypothetical protein [Halomonas mongoliensis]|uniref:hypothetical protein n=1 Tax=Halomonas mongoliensis TaxID=321265 RepID=UPI00403ABB9C
MKKIILLSALLIAPSAMVHASGSGPEDHQGQTQGVVEQVQQGVRGIYLGHDESRISVAHEMIPDVMCAMRMNLHLQEGEEVPLLAEGDPIQFTMIGRMEIGMTWYAESIEALPADTELELPESLREAIGH